jgi:ubiquinol-cytochrome c reductase cytochrome b subunit
VTPGDWLDARTGWRATMKRWGGEPIPGGARWSYVLGGLCLFAFALQALTGFLLASFYAPASTTAWAAVAYLQQEVTLGWLIRGLHASGASLLVLLTCAHLVQVAWWGAYRSPRELNWWIGLVMLGIVLAFALTGYLLPWDQKGYWATQVATSLIGETPLVGGWLRTLVQGGSDYGNLTLTHFYALHTMLLPAALTLATVVHVLLVRRTGVANPSSARTSEAFWPRQALRNTLAMALLLGWMLYRVWRTHGEPLEGPADPSSSYDARPEWYFLPLFQLLKYLPGAWEAVGALGVPLVIVLLLAALPMGASRRVAVTLLLILFAAAGALGLQARLEDRASPVYRRNRARADAEALRALELARQGVPPAGGTAVFDNDPLRRGRALFAAKCSGCHVLDGGGEPRGPQLTGWSSRAWLTDFLQDPDAPRYFGKTKKLHDMKPVKPRGDELRALVEMLYAEGGGSADAALVAAGDKIFLRESCDDCHSRDGKSAGDGAPNLGGRANRAWIAALLRDAGGDLYYEARNEMTRFGLEQLSAADIEALTMLLRAERDRSDVTPAMLR